MWEKFKENLKFFFTLLGPMMLLVAMIIGGPFLMVEAGKHGNIFVIFTFGGLTLLVLFVLSWVIALIDYLVRKEMKRDK